MISRRVIILSGETMIQCEHWGRSGWRERAAADTTEIEAVVEMVLR